MRGEVSVLCARGLGCDQVGRQEAILPCRRGGDEEAGAGVYDICLPRCRQGEV